MTLGGKGYPKCPKGLSQVPWAHYPKMFTNGHWEKWIFGEKGYLKCPKGVPQVPCALFPQMFTNGRWGKWALRANVHLGERDTLSALMEYSK